MYSGKISFQHLMIYTVKNSKIWTPNIFFDNQVEQGALQYKSDADLCFHSIVPKSVAIRSSLHTWIIFVDLDPTYKIRGYTKHSCVLNR